MRLCLWAAVAALATTTSLAKEVAVAQAPLDADVVVMGEIHDVAAHHAHQAEWVARMSPAALVFEMLPPELGSVAEAKRDAPAEVLGPALRWEARGWPDFETYDPIFKASGSAAIFGAEVSRDVLKEAAANGAAAAFGGDPARLGLDLPLPEAERLERETEQAEAHCGLLPETMLPGMVEAQRVRDAALAQRTLAALERTGGPVAVITGNGHARRDRGVPRLLMQARPDLRVISLGQFTSAQMDAPFDAWTVTLDTGARRGDPCDALR